MKTLLKTHDKDIRKALHKKRLSKLRADPNVIILDEFVAGTSRIDVAVLNGHFAGFEIKSAADTLDRLPAQIDSFCKVFDELTLVVSHNHLERASALLPSWWGLIVASMGPRRGLHFDIMWEPKQNPNRDKSEIARLLWRSEALELLVSQGKDRGVRSKPISTICNRIAEVMDLDDIRDAALRIIKSRQDWRCS
ncbi:sce7726 family protein [Azospirillum picis]|uniref:sce7726 family protein n=1 Tax=Azospirillum picis TaxID=488438 RepID=UPI0035211C87